MIGSTFKKIAIFTILIGTFAFCINFFYMQIGKDPAITYLRTENINGVIMYKFDLYMYVDNIIWTFRSLPGINFNFVTYEWQNHSPYDLNNLAQAWDDFVHNLGLIANFFILLLNLLLLPIKLIGYILQIILAIIGVSYHAGSLNPLYWAINTARTLTNLNVNYITLT